MTKFRIKKIPRGWVFVPTKKQIRELLLSLGADVMLVDFKGTSSVAKSNWLYFGIVESRVVDSGWCFYIHLWGVRETVVLPVRQELAAATLSEIENYINECKARSPAHVIKPAQLMLAFDVTSDGITSSCSVKPVDSYAHPTPQDWWRSNMANSPAALVTDKGRQVRLRVQGRAYLVRQEELRSLLGLPAGPPGLGITIEGERLTFEFDDGRNTIALTQKQLSRRLGKQVK
jgi:hypothetical protein